MNPQRQPKSRQEILRQQQQFNFVGREEQIDTFRYNLSLPPTDWYFLFNVWGQGGVGKSTLLRQFRRIAEEANSVTVTTSDSETAVSEVMGRMAEQLEQQGYRLNRFSESYKLYREKKQELETDLEITQGFSESLSKALAPAFLGRSLAKAGLGLAKQIPGSGVVTPFLDEETIAAQAGEWASHAAKKLGNQDEVRLLLEPSAVLTSLFLQELSKVAERANLVLFFDTYERTSGFLDSWFRRILEGRYGDLPINLILVIAGREELDKSQWADYQGSIFRCSLEPFTADETQQYLARKDITNTQVIDVISHLSGHLPLLVALLAAESPNDPTLIGDPSGTAVERFLKWVDDLRHRQVALDASLPRLLNRDIVAILDGEAQADALFLWLKTMPFVGERPDGWMYHEIVRTQMLRHKRLTSPKNWAELHGKLADYYDALSINLQLGEAIKWRDEIWQGYSLHRLYHRLCQSPQQYLPESLNEFLAALKAQRQFAMQYAKTLIQAGKAVDGTEVQCWGERLVDGLQAYHEKCYEVAIEMFTALLEQTKLETQWRAVALGWRGSIYQRMNCFDAALQDLDMAIELAADDAWLYARRGEMYRMQAITSRLKRPQRMELDQKALQDLNRAVELNPDNNWAIDSRGAVYRLMGYYPESLQDLNRAIEINANNGFAVCLRGMTYHQMGHYPEALQDFNRAVELNLDNSGFAVFQRGELYVSMQRYQEALQDLTHALEFEQLPHNVPSIYTDRGTTYLMLNCYEEAQSDFNQVIELEPEHDWAFYGRALCFQLLNQSNSAKADLDRAIQLATQDYEEDPQDFHNTLHLALYYLVAGNDEQMRYVYDDAFRRDVPPSRIQEAIQELERFLHLFPDHEGAKQAKGILEKA